MILFSDIILKCFVFSRSPDIVEVKDYESPSRISGRVSPTFFLGSGPAPPVSADSPVYIPPEEISCFSNEDDITSISSHPDDSAAPPLPEEEFPRVPPLPDDEIPFNPPLPEDDLPAAPPLPDDDDIPSTPPDHSGGVPQTFSASDDDNPCTTSVPDSDIPRTPPLPDDNSIPSAPPLPEDDIPKTPPPPEDDVPRTPPIPFEYDQPSTPPLHDKDSPGTPPVLDIRETKALTSSVSRGITTLPLPSMLADDTKESGRLTPPHGVSPGGGVPTEQAPLWKGIIHLPDVANFHAAAFEVS